MRSKTDLHLSRKAWHVLTGVFAIIFTYKMGFDSRMAAIVSGSIAGTGLILELLRLTNPKFNDYVFAKFGKLFRDSERTRPSGLVFYALGVSLSFLFYEWDIAMMSILILVFADPFASFVGILLGRRKVFGQKSLMGVIACFCMSLTVVSIYNHINSLGLSLLVLILFGLSGALSELITIIDDNLSIPVVSGGLLTAVLALSNFYS